MAVSAAVQARIHAAVRRNEEPSPIASGLTLWVGAPRVKVANADGTLTEAGRFYVHLSHKDPRRFRQAVQKTRDGVDFVTEHGRRRYLTRRDPAHPGTYVPTAAGRAHYHYQVHWTVLVPATAEKLEGDASKRWTHSRRAGGGEEEVTIPITDTEIVDTLSRLPEYGWVRDERPDGEQHAFIQRAVRAYLRSQARDPIAFDEGREQVVLKDFTASGVKYYYDPSRPMHFDEKSERFRKHEPPQVEVLLNQPLRGLPEPPMEMYMKHLMIPEAWKDFDGQCVAHQLVAGMLHRKQHGNARDGSLKMGPAVAEHTLESMTRIIDEAFDFLYPGQGPRLMPVRRGPTAYEQSKLGGFVEGWRAKMKWGRVYTLDELTRRRRAPPHEPGPPGLRQRAPGGLQVHAGAGAVHALLRALLQRQGPADLRPVQDGPPRLRGGGAGGLGRRPRRALQRRHLARGGRDPEAADRGVHAAEPPGAHLLQRGLHLGPEAAGVRRAVAATRRGPSPSSPGTCGWTTCTCTSRARRLGNLSRRRCAGRSRCPTSSCG